MNVYSLFSFVASLIYLYLGIYVFSLDKKSRQNQIFLALYFCFFLWALSYSFMCSSPDNQTAWTWYKVTAISLYFIVSLAMHFILAVTEKTNSSKHWWVYIALYFPSILLSVGSLIYGFHGVSIVKNKVGWLYNVNSVSSGIILFSLFSFTCTVLSFFLCIKWTRNSDNRRIRLQMTIGMTGFAITCMLIVVTEYILPIALRAGIRIPTPLTVLAWAFAVWYGLVKYRSILITPSVAADRILETVVDSLILTGPDGEILRINPGTQNMLGYTLQDLLRKPLSILFKDDKLSNVESIVKLLEDGPIDNYETLCNKKDGTQVPVIMSASQVRNSDGSPAGFIIISKDITERKNVQDKLEYLATHDFLTGLPNRLSLNETLKKLIQHTDSQDNILAVMLLDLDRFKEINDVMGHSNGDILLNEVSLRLKDSLYTSDIVARLGGDEFIIVLREVRNKTELEFVAEKVLKCLSKPYLIDNSEINITCSAGISLYPADGKNVETLIKNADLAMYKAKNLGGNGYQFFNTAMSEFIAEKVALKASLRKALEQNEFVVYYQPIFDIKTSFIMGMEALVRWNSKEMGMVSPGKFIPVAEESGLIIPVGEWVLRTACAQCRSFHDKGFDELVVSVNVSTVQFQQKDFVTKVRSILKETGLDAQYLQLEITENTAISDVETTINILKEFHTMGISISIDDFGVGYSSLSYLRKLPIQSIKIDRSFITDVTCNSDNAAIVTAIFAMAQSINLDIVAEGVETKEQLCFLTSLLDKYTGSRKPVMAQGYLFSRPVPANEFDKLLSERLVISA